MIHLNPLALNTGTLEQKFSATIGPQMYWANGVDDFLKEKQNVVPSDIWKVISWTLALRHGGGNFLGKALIFLHNLQYQEINYTAAIESPSIFPPGPTVCLEDVTGKLTLTWDNIISYDLCSRREQLRRSDFVYEAALLYNPRKDEMGLIDVKKRRLPSVQPVVSSSEFFATPKYA